METKPIRISDTTTCLPGTHSCGNVGSKYDTFRSGRKYKVRVPTRTGKPGKMGRHFPVRENSGNFEQTGKVR